MGRPRAGAAFWAVCGVAFALRLGGGVAAAQPPPPSAEDVARAQRHFEAGEAYFAEARYDDAAREFGVAYELSQRPEMLFNISIANERGLRFDDAIAALERYLAAVEPSERAAAERRLVRLRELRDRHHAQQAGTPASGPDPAPDRTEPVALPPQAAPVDEGGGSSTGAWIAIGGGAAAGIGALITGLIAHSTYTDLEAQCPSRTGCDPALEDDRDSAATMAWVSTLLTGVAVIAAGVGVTLLVAF